MAILYKANETNFSHLGLGPLNDAVSILVTEERNGIFELEMKYPVSGKVFHELKNDRIIKADAGHKLKDQRFKIIRITKPLKGVVTVYAEHVSYLTQDLALKPKVTFSGNARQALEHWKANLVDDNPLTVWSDISTTGKINWTIDEVENARRALGGVQGSILDVYGGEYLFDNYDIYLYQKRGVNSELLIAYGRNLVDLEQEEEIANTYTSIYPYSIYTDDDGNERMVTLPEYYIDSEHVDKYARRKILVVDFTTEEIKTVSALRSAARRYIKDNDVGVPRVNLKIQYVDLAKTLDYKHLALYEEVNLCDNVMIYFEKYDINTTAKVIKVVWDVLNERYDSIEVGEARASLSQAIDTVVDGKVHSVEKLAMQTLRTADGKNTIYFGLEEPLATQYPLKKNDIWYRIVDGEFTRTYIYDGVVWQLVIDMDSAEAKAEAQQAKDRADDAVIRANQATQLANNAINQAQTSFDLAQESLTLGQGLTSRMSDAEGNLTALNQTTLSLAGRLSDAEGNLTTLTATVNGLQTTVSDVQGNVSNLTQLSTTLQSRLSDAEGNINTLTQTVDATVSRISSLANPNLITHDPNEWGEVFGFKGVKWRIPVKKHTDYVLTDYSSELVDKIQINYGGQLVDANVGGELKFNPGDDDSIGFTITSSDPDFFKKLGTVYRFKLEEGTESTAWTAHDEDIYTQYSQLSDAINLRVAKGDVLSQINIEAGRTLIQSNKLILDADTTVVTGDFKVGNANITSLDAGKIRTGTLDAGRISVINLSANSIVGGILQSQNSNTYMDLNTGEWYKENSDITLGGGANINFIDAGNKLQYDLNGRKSGVAFTTAIGGEYPLVALGVTTKNSNLNITDEARFSGFIANGRARYDSDGILNSVVGLRFDIRDETVDFSKGFTFRLGGNTIRMYGMNSGSYDYHIGAENNSIARSYIRENYANGTEYQIRYTHRSRQGFAMMMSYQDEPRLAFYGLNSHSGEHYGLGKSNRRFNWVYLNNNPDVSSDSRLKKDIDDNELGLDFINDLQTKVFTLNNDSHAKPQLGFIAQDVLSTLHHHNASHLSVVTQGDDGFYGMQYTQLIAPTIKAIQELDTKLNDEVSFLKLKIQYLEQKIEQLEAS